jgi:hypothetical protein
MAQRVWFTNDPVVMLNIDVEGDGKQIVTRVATEQDKANYAPQFQEMQGGGGAGTTPQGAAGQPTLAAQQSGQSGTTTRDLQAAQGQPNQQPQQPSGTNPPR